MEDKDIQLITQRFDTLQSSMTTQFKGINDRLDKINGRVGKTEDEIQLALIERGANRQKQEDYFKSIDDLYMKVDEIDKKERNHVAVCPVVTPLKEIDKRVRILEDSNLATVSRSGLIKSAIAMLAVVLGITVSIMKITENHAEANTQSLLKAQDTIMRNQQVIYKEINTLLKNQKDENTKLDTKN